VAACRLTVRHAFVPEEDGGLGLRRLTADAAVGNDASHRVLEHAGFRLAGRDRDSIQLPDGSFVDALRYDQLADDLTRS
jgi:RimJ/RimL family protein N-acetyltransferase